MLKVIFFLILTSSTLFCQNISGKIYGEENVVEYVKILNITQNLIVFSDENGDFTINAIENDSISFSSPFYEEKKIIVNKDYFDEVFVVELQKKINELDEVVVKNYVKNGNFDVKEFSLKFKNQMNHDFDNNLQAYEEPSNGSMDFRKIFKRINKLLRRNKNTNTSNPTYASYYDLKAFFSKDNYFNDKLIIEVLKIQKENIPLFVEFCDGKIENKLFASNNNFLLLDSLIKLAIQFRKTY